MRRRLTTFSEDLKRLRSLSALEANNEILHPTKKSRSRPPESEKPA